ncbi:MAG: hypothetical protein HGA22_10660 [Clostridiales bacterium]|nr:hypothetical protein [Clostridiales bacterium]
MKIFNNISIPVKLVILISLFVIAILIVGTIGYVSSVNSEKAMLKMYDHNLKAIESLSDIRQQTRASYANILKLLVISDKEVMAAALADIEKRSGTIEKQIAVYEGTEFDPAEAEKYKIMKENLAAWLEFQKSCVDLISTGKITEATEKFTASGDKVFDAMQSVVRDIQAINIKDTEATFTNNANSVRLSTIILFIVIIVTIAICLLFAILITKSITKPLKKVTELIIKTSTLDLVKDESFLALMQGKMKQEQ